MRIDDKFKKVYMNLIQLNIYDDALDKDIDEYTDRGLYLSFPVLIDDIDVESIGGVCGLAHPVVISCNGDCNKPDIEYPWGNSLPEYGEILYTSSEDGGTYDYTELTDEQQTEILAAIENYINQLDLSSFYEAEYEKKHPDLNDSL